MTTQCEGDERKHSHQQNKYSLTNSLSPTSSIDWYVCVELKSV